MYQCKEIASMDWLSKSDPIAELFVKSAKDDDYVLIGTTEMQKNTYSPKFSVKIECAYCFEARQFCKFVLYDVNSAGSVSMKKEEIGHFECKMSKIMTAPNCYLVDAPLQAAPALTGKKVGTISVLAEAVKGRRGETLKLKMSGKNMLNKDGLFGKSDPYLKIKAIRGDGSVEDVPGNTTKWIDNEENPIWEELCVSMFELCRGDVSVKVRLEAWDKDDIGSDDQIGLVDVTLAEIFAGKELEMIDYKTPPRDLKPGSLQMVSGSIERVPTFFDYLEGGTEFSASVAIDFTASNLQVLDPVSLHYLDDDKDNQYQTAIQAVISIIEDYDTDKRFACWGFGAVLTHLERKDADHCFPLTFDESNAEVHGVAGVMEAYRNAVSQVKLYGPTNFAPVIQAATERALRHKKDIYHVLLIITDGEISDMQETKDAIVKGADAPLSIIVIGVGKEDFSNMKELDSDTGALVASDGKQAVRDIVQFVPFNKSGGDPVELAKSVLAELPMQVVSHMCAAKQIPPAFAKATVPFSAPEGDWFGKFYNRCKVHKLYSCVQCFGF